MSAITNPKFPALAQPGRIGAIKLRNRVIMSSLTRSRSGDDKGAKDSGSMPNELNHEYYRQKAAGGIGLIMTGKSMD